MEALNNTRDKGNKPKNKQKASITKRYDDALKNNILLRFLVKAIGGIILAILVGFSMTFLTQYTQENERINKEISFVNSLCIGTNEENVNSILGYPFLKSIDEKTNITDCLYRIDGAIVRLFYENNSAKGIFITITDNSAKGIFMFKYYSWLTNDIKLGTYTFDEIEGYLDGNYFQHTNGIDIWFYIEKYWGMRFIDQYFAIFPYGITLKPKESRNSAKHYDQEAGQMGGEYPNTIGIVNQQYMEKICAIILDIDRIDYDGLSFDVAEDSYYYEENIDLIRGDAGMNEEEIKEINDGNFDENDYFEECLTKYLEEHFEEYY